MGMGVRERRGKTKQQRIKPEKKGKKEKKRRTDLRNENEREEKTLRESGRKGGGTKCKKWDLKERGKNKRQNGDLKERK